MTGTAEVLVGLSNHFTHNLVLMPHAPHHTHTLHEDMHRRIDILGGNSKGQIRTAVLGGVAVQTAHEGRPEARQRPARDGTGGNTVQRFRQSFASQHADQPSL
eukprot:9519911-Alexandrium_andersonii.AAC.1